MPVKCFTTSEPSHVEIDGAELIDGTQPMERGGAGMTVGK